MKSVLFFATLILSCSGIYAQQRYEVPEDYYLEAPSDYDRYAKDVIATTNWLFSTPLDQATAVRRNASQFIIAWTSGSPKVNITVFEGVVELSEKNPEMLVLYMAACAKWTIENNYSENDRPQQKAALKAMADFYDRGNGATKDPKLDKLVRRVKDNKLDAWLDEQFKG